MGKRTRRQPEPGEDCGESTESCEENPNQPCPHIVKAVSGNTLRKIVKSKGLEVDCSECEKNPSVAADDEDWDKEESSAISLADLSLWMCLQCGSQLCSRSKRQHALDHFNKPHSDRHELAANTTTWQVYCYSCQRLVPYSSTKKLQEVVELLKKQSISAVSRDINIDDKIAEVATTSFKAEPSTSSEYIRNVYNVPASSHGLYNFGNYSLQNSTQSSTISVRGLYNFGNTCFFNSVVQCLVQTPYLTTVLRKTAQGGITFRLEGGKIKIDDKETELQPIQGELGSWGQLTEILTTTLETLATPGTNGVFHPMPLYKSFVAQFQQFGDNEQHDSHELLRQLLEGVRNEDLRRYQKVLLHKLNLDSKEKRSALDNETKQVIKFYGQKAAEKLLGPEQVFRGFLVSTLQCQECQHTSERTESFLDLSLPVTSEKPQPPAITRRKGIPEEQSNNLSTNDETKPQQQQKKDRSARKVARRGKRAAKTAHGEKQNENSKSDLNENKVDLGSKSSSEQSDADVEDNLEDNASYDKAESSNGRPACADTAANFALYHMESGYNSEKLMSSDSIRTSPVDVDNKEKSDGSPERLDKEESFTLSSAIPLWPGRAESPHLDSGVASPDAGKSDTPQATSKELGSPSSLSSEMNMDLSSPRQDVSLENDLPRPTSHISVNSDGKGVENGCTLDGEVESSSKLDKVIGGLDEFKLNEGVSNRIISNKYPPNLSLAVNDNSVFDTSANSPDYESSKRKKNSTFFNSTMSPHYQCDEGEYSVQSCLNQFTSSELLAGNNKVGCEACTKRANTGKTIYTNATKRFLIASPPAVLILHLKRFQIGPRCIFRKITKHVNFPLILDIAPFCSEKIKSLPIVSPDQSKLLYSLYGVVEHSGGMHGGHYVAYVKVRPKVEPHDKRWSFMPTDNDENGEENNASKSPVNGVNGDASDSSTTGYESSEGASGYTPMAPEGKWFYISDSRVQEVPQESVLKTQAYLLFYERIM